MFNKADKERIDRVLERAQLQAQAFRTESPELQELWQAIVHIQVQLGRIKACQW